MVHNRKLSHDALVRKGNCHFRIVLEIPNLVDPNVNDLTRGVLHFVSASGPGDPKD